MTIGVDLSANKELAALMAKLRKVAPDVAKETKQNFKAAAQDTLRKIKSRQPKKTGELRRKTRITVARGVPAIRSSADHARISEFGGRHPLWGNRDRWVAQPPAPAIWPSVQEDRAEFLRRADRAVSTAMRKAGFT